MQVRDARERYVHWLLAARDLSPHTIRAYDGDIAAFERHLGVRSLVSHIDRDRLVAFIAQQRAAGLSSVSLRRRASGLRGFFTWLRERRLLDVDPWIGTTVPVGRSQRLPRLLTKHELDRLFGFLRTAAQIDARGWDVVLERPHESTTLLGVALMVSTGVRVNELVSIRCQDIDLASRGVRILGKGRREREVFLPNDWIQGLAGAYLRTRTSLGVEHAQLLFNRLRRPLTTGAMRARLVTVAHEAGLRARVTPHMLRHTAATQLIEAGVDIRYIQRLLGHASLRTTEIYTHVSNAALRRVISDADVLGRSLGPR